MAVGQIISRAIATGAIGADQIATGAITAADIPAGEITADKLHQTLDFSTKTFTMANAHVTQAMVTQHQSALSVTESQVSDLQSYVLPNTSPTFTNTTLTGYLAGPASFVIDPAGVGDNTGTVVIAGNLQVDGTQTTINSTTVSIDDLKLSVATDAADSAAANGAGIIVGGANANITYTHATTSWDFDKPVNVTGAITATGISQFSDVNIPDNNAIRFGNSQDLQIYHNGNHSWITNSTGYLHINAANIELKNAADNETMLLATQNGAVKISYDNSVKLTTTSTGIDVTGTVTSDGLTVNSGTTNTTATFQSTDAGAYVNFTDTTGTSGIGNETVHLYLDVDKDNVVANSQIRFRVDGSSKVTIKDNGYVGIGTTSPDEALDVKGNFTLRDTTGNLAHGMSVFGDDDQYAIFNQESNGDGGLRITALSDSTVASSAFQVNAVATTVSNDGNNAVIRLRAAKKNGTTETSLDTTEDVLSINNTGTELIVIKGNGYMGLGTSEPSALLHLRSGTSYQPHILLENNVSSAGDAGITFADSVENYAYRLGTDDSGNGLVITHKSGIDPVHGVDNEFFRMTTSGNISIAGNFTPTTATQDLGSTSNPWQNIYTQDMHLSNESRETGNEIDGTKGNWTIQEGAEDLYIINNKSGKRFRFKLEELD